VSPPVPPSLSGPSLSGPRRVLSLLLGGVAVGAALVVLGVEAVASGPGVVLLHLSGVAVLSAVLLISGATARPPRWRPARLLLGVLALLDVFVLSFLVYFATGLGDAGTRGALQAANWLLAVAAPFAIGVGLPRPAGTGSDAVV
jgi:hypothetical protein